MTSPPTQETWEQATSLVREVTSPGNSANGTVRTLTPSPNAQAPQRDEDSRMFLVAGQDLVSG